MLIITGVFFQEKQPGTTVHAGLSKYVHTVNGERLIPFQFTAVLHEGESGLEGQMVDALGISVISNGELEEELFTFRKQYISVPAFSPKHVIEYAFIPSVWNVIAEEEAETNVKLWQGFYDGERVEKGVAYLIITHAPSIYLVPPVTPIK